MKNWPISCTRLREHPAAAAWGLAALTAALALLSLGLGAADLRPGEVLRALAGQDPGSVAARVVLYARLPRVCGSLLAGAMAGVLLVLFFSEATGASRITLVLAGVAISNIFSALIDAVTTVFPDALTGYTDFRMGGLAGVSLARIAPAAVLIGVSLAAAAVLAGDLDLLALGPETARSLGLRVRPARLVFLALAAALAGAAVSFCGLVGFVGLLVPHIVRRLVGGESRPLLLYSALGGAALLTVCDLLARLAAAPFELPVGTVLSLVGGPFFLWLLIRQRGGRTHD